MIAHPSISTPSYGPFRPPLQATPEKGPTGEGWGEGSSSYTFSSPYDSVSSSPGLSVSAHPSVSPPHDPGLKTQDSPSSPDLALWPFGDLALSPADSQLLESLVAAPSITSYAAANNLPLTTLALWLQQPDIAEAHAALLELKALDRRAHHEQLADEALEVLRETMRASEDPIERRRCANTILRAIARTNRPSNRPRSASEGPPSPSSGAGHSGPPPSPTPPSNPSASVHPSSFILHPSPIPTPPCGGGQAQAQLEPGGGASPVPDLPSAHLPSAISPPPAACPPDLALWPFGDLALSTAIAANKPAPTPSETITADPESLTDLAAARLAALPDPTGNRLYLAIYNLIDLDLRMGPKTWDPFKRTLEASPFVTCRPTEDQPWIRTDHPVELKGETATRRYSFTHPDGRTTHCTLALAPRGPNHYNPTHWWITHLNTPNTS